MIQKDTPICLTTPLSPTHIHQHHASIKKTRNTHYEKNITLFVCNPAPAYRKR